MSAPVRQSDRITAALVLLDGHLMPLRGLERKAAVQLALNHGMSREEAARRLRITVPLFALWARRAGITYPIAPQTIEAWACSYLDSSNSKARYRQRRRAARRAAA